MTNEKPADESAAWLEHNLSQLRYFRSLSLRSKLEAVQGMADVVRRFRELRAEGRFRAAGDEAVPGRPTKP